jgi:hypothetical protein
MSIKERMSRALGLESPTKPTPTPQEIQDRLAWMRTPQYQALRRATFARMGVNVENAEQQNEPGDHEWLYSGGGR